MSCRNTEKFTVRPLARVPGGSAAKKDGTGTRADKRSLCLICFQVLSRLNYSEAKGLIKQRHEVRRYYSYLSVSLALSLGKVYVGQ